MGRNISAAHDLKDRIQCSENGRPAHHAAEKMNIDPKFFELPADVARIILLEKVR